MDANDLKTFVGAPETDTDFVNACWQEAELLVDAFIGSSDVPSQVRDRAVMETGSELFHRRQAPNGIAQFSTLDGSPIRIARDPMVGAYTILRPWVLPL